MPIILVVEDDPEINALMALSLRMENLEVIQANNGSQALQLVEQHTPDLVLMDVMMPQMSGYEIAMRLHDKPETANVPIIFVTAKHELEDRVQGLEMAVDYICKPFAVPELLARVRAALRMQKLQEELRSSNEMLLRLAVTDELTGLCNRRGFDSQLEDELWRARRFADPIALLVFDLDRFKSVNDTWGHAQGDLVLQAFARVLLNSSRHIDRVARYGGEEFIAMLPATDATGAAIFAEKVRTATAELEVAHGVEADGAQESLPPIKITVSGGGAVVERIPQQAPIAALATRVVQEADRCLYKAKESGRNRVIIESLDSEE